ncbi:MAG: hypothetical protein WCG27_04360 [Pseudomonadota bacterium]
MKRNFITLFFLAGLLLSYMPHSISAADPDDDGYIEELPASENASDDLALEIGPNLSETESNKENEDSSGVREEFGVWHDLDWENLDEKTFLNYREWKKERLLQDESPDWQGIWRLKDRPEIVGRVLDCVGSCVKYRGEGKSKSEFRSPVREGEEIHTLNDSYIWIYLMDGTLVRLSPNSSITFNEINIGQEEIFLHARVNFGNILWLSRLPFNFTEQSERETDSIFLPLRLFKANYIPEETVTTEDNLAAFLQEDSPEIKLYKRLNELIDENNQVIKRRPTYSFVVMPNGTLWGKNLMAEMVVLTAANSYFQCRSFKRYNKEINIERLSPQQFFFRGDENTQGEKVFFDQWYKTSADGRSLTTYDQTEINLSLGEFLTQRIPTILLARELMLQELSLPIFTPKLDKKNMAHDMGYRIWGHLTNDKIVDEIGEVKKKYKRKKEDTQDMEPGVEGETKVEGDASPEENSADEEEGEDEDPDSFLAEDMQKRLDFLKIYTRRLETINITQLDLLRKNMDKRGEKYQIMKYDQGFYRQGLKSYLMRREKQAKDYHSRDRDVLNSTKKIFWKMIHHRRD